MSETLEVVDSPHKVAVGRADYVFPWNIGKYVEESFQLAEEYLKTLNLEGTGTKYSRYFMFTPVLTYMEVGIQVASDSPALSGSSIPSTLKKLEIPECKTAAMWYVGPYDKLSEVWRKFCPKIKAEGHRPGNICWEEYFTDPKLEPDLSKHRTRVFWSLVEAK